MYELLNNKNNFKGKYLYYLHIDAYEYGILDIILKRIYVRLDRKNMYTQTRQLVYDGGNITIPLSQLDNNDKFIAITDWGHTIISTQKLELQRFLRKQINLTYKKFYIYQKEETDGWKNKIMSTIQQLKTLR